MIEYIVSIILIGILAMIIKTLLSRMHKYFFKPLLTFEKHKGGEVYLYKSLDSIFDIIKIYPVTYKYTLIIITKDNFGNAIKVDIGNQKYAFMFEFDKSVTQFPAIEKEIIHLPKHILFNNE